MAALVIMAKASASKLAVQQALYSLLPTDVAASTRAVYASNLKQIWKHALHMPERQLEGSTNNFVYEHLDTILPWVLKKTPVTTRRNYLTVLLVTCKDTDAHEMLKTEAKKLNVIVDAIDGEQELDAKEMEFFKTHAELLEILNAFENQVQQLSAWQDSRPMTHEEAFGHQDGWVILFRYLAFLVMVKQPPLRGNWGAVKFDNDESADGYLKFNMDNRYLLLHINKDKVSSKYGAADVPITDYVRDAILKSFKVWPRLWVFPNKFDPGLPMGVSSFCEFLRKTDFPGTDTYMYQGVQLLRASYITWFYDDKTHTLNNKQELARCMRHSQATAEKCYRKLL